MEERGQSERPLGQTTPKPKFVAGRLGRTQRVPPARSRRPEQYLPAEDRRHSACGTEYEPEGETS